METLSLFFARGKKKEEIARNRWNEQRVTKKERRHGSAGASPSRETNCRGNLDENMLTQCASSEAPWTRHLVFPSYS